MRFALLLVLALLVPACLVPPAPEDGRAPGTADALALTIGPAVRIDREQPAREPSILQAPDGALYVAGFWGFARVTEYRGTTQNVAQGPLVWKSMDEGATWRPVSPGTAANGAMSNSDLDLAVDPQGGLYLATLTYYSVPVPAGAPVDPATTLTVSVGSSLDGGATWRWSRLDQGGARSHPWVAVDAKGVVHVVWGDEQGIRHAESADRGATWRASSRVHASASESGGIVAAPDGTLAVRTTSVSKPLGPGQDGVAVSTDGGATWKFHSVPANRPSSTPRGFDSVAFDAAGRLYYVWTEDTHVYLADKWPAEEQWRTTQVATEPNGTVAYYPYLRGGPAGEVAATWFRRDGDTVAARVAHVTGLNGTDPVARVGSFVEKTGGTNHADYYQVTFLRDGRIAAAVPVVTPDMGQWFDYRTAS